MNLWKLSKVAKVLILVICCLSQQVSGRSIVKNLLRLHILKNILKPKFVPLPIPLPLPIKFTKNTHKAYPVPVYSHSLSANHIDASPLSFHLGGGYNSLAAGHKLSSAAYLSSTHGLSDLSTGHYKGPNLPLETPPQVPEAVLKLLEKLDEIENLKISHHIAPPSSHKLLSSDDHSSELIHDSNNLHAIHDDIHAVGGFDLLDDLDFLGNKQDWWK